MVYAETTLGKTVNWMTMRVLFKSKIIITLDVLREQRFIDGGLGRMMDMQL
jgi:hypothetical protein